MTFYADAVYHVFSHGAAHMDLYIRGVRHLGYSANRCFIGKQLIAMYFCRKNKFCVFAICLTVALLIFIINNRLENRITNSVNAIGDLLREANLRKAKGVPRIIHFIWNNETLPTEFVDNLKSFVKNNPVPTWEYYFWTKASGLQFIKDKYNFLYQRISNDPVDLLRADVVRYLAIHEYGGFYFDLDTVSIQPLDYYATTHQCSLALEPDEHLFLWNMDLLISSAALVCVPEHPFYKLIIDKLSKLGPICHDTFMCSGPNFITHLFRAENQTLEGRSRLPDLQPSEIFQDAYDVEFNAKNLKKNCLDTTPLDLSKAAICDNWKARGMGKRKLSPKAITYHTWYHTKFNPVTYSKENTIFNIIPDVKIYGHNLDV